VKIIFLVSVAAFSLAQSSAIAAVPAALMNKTVTTSFTVSIPATGSNGSTRSASRSVTRTAYISTAGRIFSQHSRRAGGQSERVERGPEVTANSFRFDGNRLVTALAIGNGASQLTITFDSGFQSCTAQVVTGGQGGRPMTWKGLDGIVYTATGPATASSPSCSIQAGNAFAGQ
jgi:hypothetical protein